MFPINVKNYFKSLIWPLDEIDRSVPKKGTILELGCAEGYICEYLAKRSANRKVIGIDTSSKKIKSAPKNIHNLFFRVENALLVDLSKVDCIVMSDFLHHIDKMSQKTLINKIPKRTGWVIIKEIDKDERVRSTFSRFFDFILYPKDKINYRSSKDWQEILAKKGYLVSVSRTNRFFPGSTTLIVAARK